MNLFVAIVHPSEAQVASINDALNDSLEIYSTLASETIGSRVINNGELLLGWVSSSKQAAAPREYVYQDSEQVVLFTGLPIDATQSVNAHRASELATSWDSVAGNLEGIHSLVKVTNSPARLEIQSDLLAYEHIFYRQVGKSWVFSNSVALIERVTSRCELNPGAVALFVSCGRMASDYTLLSEIKTVPAVTRVIWNSSTDSVDFVRTEEVGDLFKDSRPGLDESETERLASELQGLLSTLDRHFSPLDCALTGGKDSRVIFSLLTSAGIPANYYTHGQNRSEDAILAEAVAATEGLPHEFRETQETTLLGRWEELATAAVRRADGMYPIQHVASLMSANENYDGRLSIRLSGSGGAIGKGGGGQPRFYSRQLGTPNGFIDHVGNIMAHPRQGLMRPEGLSAVKSIVGARIASFLDSGIATSDVPEVSSAYEGTARGDGANMRATADVRDTFSPFCTRSFQRASALFRSRDKITCPLHRALISHLSPNLMGIPFDKKNPHWGPQQAWKILLKGTYSRYHRRIRQKLFGKPPSRPNFIVQNETFNRGGWLEHQLNYARQRILDQKSKALWECIDRKRAEELLSSDTRAEDRVRAARGLYQLWTVAEYEHAR